MIFGFSRKIPRKPKDPDVAPGLEVMLELTKLKKIGARPPPVEDLIAGWNSFITHKLKDTRSSINDLQAGHLLRVFEHLREERNDGEGYLLGKSDLVQARRILKRKSQSGVHIKFSRAIYDELVRRQESDGDDMIELAFAVAKGGEAASARAILQELQINPSDESLVSKASRTWNSVLKGFMYEQNESELVKTAHIMENLGRPYNDVSQMTMVTFFATRDNVEETKRWASNGSPGDPIRPTAGTLKVLLEFSIRNKEYEWCKDLFRSVIGQGPSKRQWDIIFQWAAGVVGKGVDDVERMMEVMVRRSPDDAQMRPDIMTINGLVKLGISQKDPYLAERYINLGLRRGIHANAETFILQMDYRVEAGDMSGAKAAYDALQSEEILEDEDLPAINKYLRALCSTPNSHHELITSILSDLEARKVRLEPDTTSGVAMMFMEREDERDVYDILQTNTYHYTLEERARIRDKFLEFILDRNRSNARVWDAYDILRNIFDETNATVRTQLMNEFFDRGRSDMASHVFGHMRQHILADRKPTRETYIACLEGIASCADSEALEMVHNMFKMDSNMEPNTTVYNALMLAYTSVGKGHRALDFWEDITNSIEGPTYRSLEIVFRACQNAPYGDITAKEVWSQMRRMDIEITREVFNAYIGALAQKGKIDEAKDMIDACGKEFGFKPDFMTFGIFYNAIPSVDRKETIEGWGKGMYPEAWAELEKIGKTTVDEGWVTIFDIKREWKA
ncbi:putative complex I intermediate-associated protein 84, mitochondrial [Amylocarpus encephaloides]|uniref:Complex I intermediate-associated protein 84, mitochondrial n=1 Tax=Amylocarpus encephaloides TaxID=45428 RepID=A0A9P7YRN4_9HELO|nr:putative complex I intermediate-associated protein 84, mitochondrial [Amylocarpus encephaloides]